MNRVTFIIETPYRTPERIVDGVLQTMFNENNGSGVPRMVFSQGLGDRLVSAVIEPVEPDDPKE